MKKIYTTPELEITIVEIQNILNISTGEPTSITGPISADGKVRFDDASTVINTDDTQW